MNLTGSKIEDEFRKQFAASHQSLVNGDETARLRSALQAHGAEVSRCMVVNWIPEQGEEIYDVLYGSEVFRIEIPHDGSEVIVQSEALADYKRRRHGRPQRIKLAVALDILQKDSVRRPPAEPASKEG